MPIHDLAADTREKRERGKAEPVDTDMLMARLAGGLRGLAEAVWREGIPADGPVADILADYERWKEQRSASKGDV